MSVFGIVQRYDEFICQKCGSFCTLRGDMVTCDNKECENHKSGMPLSNGEIKEYRRNQRTDFYDHGYHYN